MDRVFASTYAIMLKSDCMPFFAFLRAPLFATNVDCDVGVMDSRCLWYPSRMCSDTSWNDHEKSKFDRSSSDLISTSLMLSMMRYLWFKDVHDSVPKYPMISKQTLSRN